ncbi:MAG: DUF2828 domain-containing protein, partial [Candidatus Marinimicrobia bacterium]|nr:DUF2828 domain-containing protein [Candidatus Neomarinimicrobiota bacterium]
MATLVAALDNYTPTQIGDNCHTEYGWSNNIREQILQYSFQVTRTTPDTLCDLGQRLENMLTSLKNTINVGSLPEREVARGYLSILYRMIGHTRDIVDGKGEYSLTYMMIYAWYKFYPELAKFALKCLVDLGDKTVHQYGSWKDIKYFCQYCKSQCGVEKHELILYAIELTNDQLKLDNETLIYGGDNISLVAKWIPRESSQFGWLNHHLAVSYFHYIDTAKRDTIRSKAILKSKTEYRKMLSRLNKKLDTLQIKQCGLTWSEIDFKKVTSISMTKQKKAFQNIKQDGTARYPENTDRTVCAEQFGSHIQAAIKDWVEVKGRRISMVDFTKQALSLLRHHNPLEVDLLNSQWRDSSSLSGDFGKMIAMVDVSGSMEGDPICAAIALGIRIADKSVLGRRIMTFSAKPTWVNLENYSDFVSQVGVIKQAEWGMNTNFYSALDTILDAIIQNKMQPEDVQDMILVVLSDMQMDQGDACDKQVLYDTMNAKYEAAGIRVHGKAYKPPHVLFWNMRSTSGFPCLSTQANCSMM